MNVTGGRGEGWEEDVEEKKEEQHQGWGNPILLGGKRCRSCQHIVSRISIFKIAVSIVETSGTGKWLEDSVEFT